MPLSALKAEAPGPGPETLFATARFMADRGIFGVVWLDDELRAVERYGELVDTIPLGVPVSESVAAYLGFEDEIAALKRDPHKSVAIPSVMMEQSHRQEERVNLAIFWMEALGRYLLLVARAVSRADLEHKLAAEVRGRAIAEAEVAAQAKVIRRANEELAIANRDLGEFASVISHDLRAPLRALRYAAEAAGTALAEGDRDTTAGNLDKVIHQTGRMRAMLTGLLDYARVGRKSDAAEPVDTGALTDEIVNSLAEGSSFAMRREGSWPTIVTLAEPFDIVLRNLIDNAVKHHDRDSGQIRIKCVDGDAQLVISVSDDGPGIDPAWHAAIFQPFKQIADQDESEGAGIGLALVKKTVERMGGSIEVISEPTRRRGATFRYSWPKRIEQDATKP